MRVSPGAAARRNLRRSILQVLSPCLHHSRWHPHPSVLHSAHRFLSTAVPFAPPPSSPLPPPSPTTAASLSSISTASGFIPINPALTSSPPSQSTSTSLPPTSPPSPTSNSTARPPARKPTFLRNTLIASFFASLFYLSYSSTQTALSTADLLISPSTDEVLDLVSRTRLTSADLIRLYSLTMQRYPLGLLTLEQYGRLVEAEVRRLKEERRVARTAHKAQREEQEKRRAEERKEAEEEWQRRTSAGETLPAVPPLTPLPDQPLSYWDETEEQEERDVAELSTLSSQPSDPSPASSARLSALRLSTRRVAFDWWELLCLFRLSTPVVGGLYDVRELTVATAQLAYDHGDWEEVVQRLKEKGLWKEGVKYGYKQKSMLRYQPWKKLEVAWRCSGGADKQGRMSYEEVKKLVERMIRTGHYSPASLTVAVGNWLPQHVLADAEFITWNIFRQARGDVRWAGDRDREEIEADPFMEEAEARAVPSSPPVHSPGSPALSSELTTYDFAFLSSFTPFTSSSRVSPPPAMCVTSHPPVPSSASLSFSEFLAISRAQGVRARGQLWYLVARDERTGERAGVIRKRRMKLEEILRKEGNKILKQEEIEQWGQQLL